MAYDTWRNFMAAATSLLLAAALSGPVSAATARYEITMTAGNESFIARFEIDDASLLSDGIVTLSPSTLKFFQVVIRGHGWEANNIVPADPTDPLAPPPPTIEFVGGQIERIQAVFDNGINPGINDFLIFDLATAPGEWMATIPGALEQTTVDIFGTYSISRITDGGGEVTPPTSVAQVVDHYLCYDAKTPKDQAKFARIEDVYLNDQFHPDVDDPLVVDVTKAKFVCTPVDKSGATIASSPLTDHFGTHLTCYEVRNPKGAPKLAEVGVDVIMTNQLDAAQPDGQSQTLEVKKPKVVCVPSDKTVVEVASTTGDGCLEGKPTALTFEFVADVPPLGNPIDNFVCAASDNLQADGKFACADGPGVFDPDKPVGITLTKDADRMGISTDPALIAIGAMVTVAAKDPGARMRSSVRLEITQQDGTGVEQVLQTLDIHASCSAPLNVGDVFGSLKLVEFVVAQ